MLGIITIHTAVPKTLSSIQVNAFGVFFLLSLLPLEDEDDGPAPGEQRGAGGLRGISVKARLSAFGLTV